MKERKWWNSVPRVPGVWWRSSSAPPRQQTVEQEAGNHQENEAVPEDCNKPEKLPELPEGVTPDDVLNTAEVDSGKDDPADVATREAGNNLRNSAPRALSTPPRRRKEFIVEGIPNISFSFFNEQHVTSSSETCLQNQEAKSERPLPPPSRSLDMEAPAPATPTDATTTTIMVRESDEVLRRVIPVNSTPVVHGSSTVAVPSQGCTKKSPNISCINIVSINTASQQNESPYASPRNSTVTPDCTTPSAQDSSMPCLDNTVTEPSSEVPCIDATASPVSSVPCVGSSARTVSANPSVDISVTAISTAPCVDDTASPISSVCYVDSVLTSPEDEDTIKTSVPCTSSTVKPSLPDSIQNNVTNNSSDLPSNSCPTPPCQDNSTTALTISLPLELSGQSIYSGTGCQDWETITDYSDYYDMRSMGSKQQVHSDYEDVQTRQEYCDHRNEDPKRRRATLMRERRNRGIKTRIRRAWRAVRGWWTEERVKLGDVIQRHAHAQAVHRDAEESPEEKVVVVRRRRDASRPPSRAPRRSRHFPQGQNGFEELRRYIKQGGDFCKDLSSILQERSEAETQYAKSLSKLSGKLLKASKDSVGTVNQAWQRAGAQMEAQSEIHRAFATALSEEVVKPLRQLVEAQHRIRKSVEAAVDKTGKSLGEWRSAEGKSKKQSFLCARENEKLQDAMLDVRLGRALSTTNLHVTGIGQQPANKEKESAKLESKRRKAEEAVKKADVEYYTFSMRAERARLEWETAVIRGSHCFQALEEERLQQLKDLAACYLHHLQEMGPKMVQGVDRLREPVESCDVARDIQTVVSIKGTGQPIPEQLLPDFYAEHITLAMNRDRRRQALVKLLQLIRQDLDRERRGKQGVENLARALQQTPTFGAEDSQQNVTEKLHHMRSMLTYLEAMRYKVQSALAELDGRARGGHPLAAHIQVTRDRQGLQQSVLKVPPWVREESLDRLAGDSPDWTDRGTADGNSVQPDSDFDEFSSQGSEKDYQSSVLTQCPVISECASETTTPVDAAPSIGRCRSLYEYTANLYDELNLQPGDIIKIHDKQADGWWLGELNGVVGIFPATYVQELD